MRFFTRFYAYAAVVIVFSAGMFHLIGLRSGNLSDLSRLLLESRRSEALRHRSEMVAHNIAVKRAVVAEIVAGRLTLHEAAARFEEANQSVENNYPDLLSDYRKPTTEKGVWEQVLYWMRTEVSSLPREQAQRILTPLEKEYESGFGRLESATDPLRPDRP